MTTENQSKFTVITNKELNNKEPETLHTNPIAGNYTNPFYEKLVKFANGSSRKRFTVEDLLR